MEKMDKIKATIMKLRERAADAASSESEAMKAIEVADRMMADNRLTLEDLEDAAGSGNIVKAMWSLGTVKLHPAQYLASSITLLTETKGWVAHEQGVDTLVYMGFESDVEYAMYLTDLAKNAMESEWELFRSSSLYENATRRTRPKMREDFMRGMSSRLREKIMAIVTERHEKDSKDTEVGTSLVVAKRGMIAEAMKDEGLNIRSRRKSARKPPNVDAFLSGRNAGDRTKIVTGIGVDK